MLHFHARVDSLTQTTRDAGTTTHLTPRVFLPMISLSRQDDPCLLFCCRWIFSCFFILPDSRMAFMAACLFSKTSPYVVHTWISAFIVCRGTSRRGILCLLLLSVINCFNHVSAYLVPFSPTGSRISHCTRTIYRAKTWWSTSTVPAIDWTPWLTRGRVTMRKP